MKGEILNNNTIKLPNNIIKEIKKDTEIGLYTEENKIILEIIPGSSQA